MKSDCMSRSKILIKRHMCYECHNPRLGWSFGRKDKKACPVKIGRAANRKMAIKKQGHDDPAF